MNNEQAQLNDFLAKRSSLFAGADLVPAFQIRYIGSEDSCKLTVESNGDLSCSAGAADAETAVAEFKETSGTPGTFDVSDTLGNTLAEVVDQIHAMTAFECVQRNGLRTTSSNDTFLAAASAQCKSQAGLTIYWDTSVLKGHMLSVTNLHTAFADYAGGKLPADPYDLDDGWTHGVENIAATFNMTYSAGAQTFKFYNGATQTHQETAGATTVQGQINLYGGRVEGTSGNIFTVTCLNDTTSSTGVGSIMTYSVQK